MTQAAEVFVVDASVAAKWHLTDEADVEIAARLLVRFLMNQSTLMAPGQIRHEVPASITAATRSTPPRLSVADGEAAIAEFLALDLILADDADLARAAYRLVHQLGIAYYDALYVALAQRHGASLITADRRCYDRIAHLPNIIWLANWQPG